MRIVDLVHRMFRCSPSKKRRQNIAADWTCEGDAIGLKLATPEAAKYGDEGSLHLCELCSPICEPWSSILRSGSEQIRYPLLLTVQLRIRIPPLRFFVPQAQLFETGKDRRVETEALFLNRLLMSAIRIMF